MNQEQNARLKKIRHDLSKLVKLDAINKWLNRKNRRLGGKTPMEKIMEGDMDELETIIYHLRSGQPN